MANNYSSATVEPNFPEDAFTKAEVEFLGAAGFTLEVANKTIYMYAEEFTEFDADQTLDQLADRFESTDALSLEDYLKQFENMSLESIFQRVIKDSKGAIPEVVIMEAYTCDKMRVGEFGGSVVRFTADNVQSAGTWSMYEWFRNNPKVSSLNEIDNLLKFIAKVVTVLDSSDANHIPLMTEANELLSKWR